MIRSGYVDVRIDSGTHRVCLVFGMRGEDLRLFRLMPMEEARAFHEHLGRILGKEK